MAFTSFSDEQQRSTYFAKYLTSQRVSLNDFFIFAFEFNEFFLSAASFTIQRQYVSSLYPCSIFDSIPIPHLGCEIQRVSQLCWFFPFRILTHFLFSKKAHVLNDEQTRWVDECVKKCYDLLAETYPYGEHFVKVVQVCFWFMSDFGYYIHFYNFSESLTAKNIGANGKILAATTLLKKRIKRKC